MPVRVKPTFIEITVTGFLKRKRGPDILRAIENGMVESAKKAIPVIQGFTPVFQGFLKKSYQVNFRKAPRRALVVSTSPPGKVGSMEAGRRGVGGPLVRESYSGIGMPPPGPIRRWVASKLNVEAKDINSVAFLVARKIAIKGIRIPLVISKKGAMFSRAIQKLGARFFGNVVTRKISRLR